MIPRWDIALVSITWLLSVIFLCYIPHQEDFTLIATGYLISFASYIYLIRALSLEPTIFIIGLAILARLLIIPAFPNLSDDIYRFIWDGRLWHDGIHPFLHLPYELVNRSEFSRVLFHLSTYSSIHILDRNYMEYGHLSYRINCNEIHSCFV